MANERTAAMDALIADSADMIDAPASADAMGDVERVARIIEPGAWLIYDMAAQCYIEGRGSRGDENYFYERTYKAGCRTLDDYRRWWETCSHSCLEETIFRWRDSSVKATAALSAMSPAGEVERLQPRVKPWLLACFGAEIAGDTLERTDRFVEEALELAQTNPAFTADRAHVLVDYVFGRPVGEPSQEVGGVMITLAALCLASGLDMHEAGETELARIWTKVDAIRAKQAAKPTGSALPIAQTIREPKP